MIRKKIFYNSGAEHSFKLRGQEVGRLEALSDGVFSLAIALLLVSSQVPKSFTELMSFMEDFPAFFLCILMTSLIWRLHVEFFLRYGLRDMFCIRINFFLLSLVLFYVYPLKFLASFLTKWLFLVIAYGLSRQRFYQEDLRVLYTEVIHPYQLPMLSVIYGIGLTLIFCCFAILHGHAYRLREQLELSDFEMRDTYYSRNWMWYFTAISFLSFLVALLGVTLQKPYLSIWSGMVFWLIPLGSFLFKRIYPLKTEK